MRPREPSRGAGAVAPPVSGSTPLTAGAEPAAESAGPASKPLAMFAVVASALMMSSLDGTIVATALPTLQRSLGTSVTLAGWTITAYSLGLVLTLPLAGKLCRRYGARRVFLAAVGVFTAASLACGFTRDIGWLIVMRMLQAAGGAGFTPAATRIVVDHFGGSRDKAVGLFGSIFTTGALIGPLLGGVIVASWSWRGVFLVNVPIGLAFIPLCLRYIPPDSTPRARGDGRLDWPGVVFLGAALFAGMVGFAYLGDLPHGWQWWAALAFAALALAAFTWHTERSADPLIPPRLIHGRGFAAVNAVNFMYGGFGSGLVALIPLYAANRYGIGALGAGSLLAAEAVGAIVLSGFGAFALRRTGYRVPLYGAVALIATGMFMLALAPVGMPAHAWLAIAAGFVGAGIGWSSPASRNAGLQLVPEEAARLAALRSTGMTIGEIAAVAIATAIIAQATAPGAAQAWVYAAYAAVLLLAGFPAARRIPDHRGRW